MTITGFWFSLVLFFATLLWLGLLLIKHWSNLTDWPIPLYIQYFCAGDNLCMPLCKIFVYWCSAHFICSSLCVTGTTDIFILEQEGFLPCQTPTSTVRLKVEAEWRMEGVGLRVKNEGKCVCSYWPFDIEGGWGAFLIFLHLIKNEVVFHLWKN